MHEYMELVFLGTGAAWPSARRNVPATVIKRGSEVLLFDCGEGTQRQFQRSTVSHMAVSRIFLTHLHGDHILGVPGLMQTMRFQDRTQPLHIYGPPGTQRFVRTVTSAPLPRPGFPVKVQELDEGSVVRGDEYVVVAKRVAHTPDVAALGFALVEDPRPGRFDRARAVELGVPEGRAFGRLQRGEEVVTPAGTVVHGADVLGPPRRGRKIVVSGDTAPCEAMVTLAHGADVLVHEATFDDTRAEEAVRVGHSTARQAAFIASRAGVRQLYLSHVSPRYLDNKAHQDQAREVFPASEVANDLDAFTVKFPPDEPVTPELWPVPPAAAGVSLQSV